MPLRLMREEGVPQEIVGLGGDQREEVEGGKGVPHHHIAVAAARRMFLPPNASGAIKEKGIKQMRDLHLQNLRADQEQRRIDYVLETPCYYVIRTF